MDLTVQVVASLPTAASYLALATKGVGQPTDWAVGHFVHSQLDSIVQCSLDVVLLIENRRLSNVAAICRIALESRIRLLCALKTEDYVAQAYISQTRKHLKCMQAMATHPETLEFVAKEKDHHEAFLASIIAKHPGLREREWNVRELADKAGLSKEYDERYSMLSQGIHNTPSGIHTKDDGFIIAYSVSFLFSDLVQTLAFLIFPNLENGERKPLTTQWQKLKEPLLELMTKQGTFSKMLDELTRKHLEATL